MITSAKELWDKTKYTRNNKYQEKKQFERDFKAQERECQRILSLINGVALTAANDGRSKVEFKTTFNFADSIEKVVKFLRDVKKYNVGAEILHGGYVFFTISWEGVENEEDYAPLH